MPSLVYITRIRPLSAELAHGLESAGFHVKSFGPGEITVDECLLVMTSEAALAGLQVGAAASAIEAAQAISEESEGILRPPDIPQHLEPQAELWQRIKAATGHEPVESPADCHPHPSAGSTVTPPASLGFVASQSGSRVLPASLSNTSGALPYSPPARKQLSENSDSSTAAARPLGSRRKSRRSRLAFRMPAWKISSGTRLFAKAAGPANRQRHGQFWQAAATTAVLLVLAVVLLASRASLLPGAADGSVVADSKQSARPESEAGGSSRVPPSRLRAAAQPANSPETAAKTPIPGAESGRHLSQYDFVAEDYTTHFDQNAHPVTTLHSSGLRHGTRDQSVQKRIVVN